MTSINREVHLVSRPVGLPTLDNFKIVEAPMPTPGAGELLIRNVWMSVDPYMRGRMYDRKSYAPPFQLDEAMGGGHVGQAVFFAAPPIPPLAPVITTAVGHRASLATPVSMLVLPLLPVGPYPASLSASPSPP